MTRKEEIITASHDKRNYPCHVIVDEIHDPILFQIGAEWADQHSREGLWDSKKVIEWIKSNEIYYEHDDVDIFVDDLRKAMEE